MPDVSLVLAPCWDVAAPPLGLGYLSAYLRASAFDTRVYDLNLAAYLESERKEIWQRQRHWIDPPLFEEVLAAHQGFIDHWAQHLADEGAPIVGLSVNAANRRFSIELARRLRARRPQTLLVWGGPGVYNIHELRIIPPEIVDYVVIGEGEETLLEITTAFRGRTRETRRMDIPGTAVPDGGAYRFNPPRAEIEDLDDLPFPTYEGFPVGYYVAENAVPVLMSRGCPMRCSFCDTTLRFKRFRYRSAGNIMAEIAAHAGRRVIGTVAFHDALLNGSVKMLTELVELMQASPLSFRWTGNFVVNRRCTAELYRAMRRAGCTRLLYGIECGSDKVLRLMNKHYTAEQAANALRWGSEAGIENHVNFICGFPGETEDDFADTLRFVERNARHIDVVTAVNMMFFVPDSPIYNRMQELGVTRSDRSHFRWHDAQGNTLEVRMSRARRLIDLLESRGIPVLGSSLDEVEIDYRPRRG